MNNLIKKILTEVRGVLDHQDEGHKSKLCYRYVKSAHTPIITKAKVFFFLSHRMKWLKVQLLPLNRMPVIIPSGFPNNLLLHVCTPWTERLLCPAQEHNTMINQVSNPHFKVPELAGH